MSKKFKTQHEHDAYVAEKKKNKTIWGVIMASSLGTLIEWYDFYIFGSLAVVLATKFFPADNPTAAFLSTLATFAARSEEHTSELQSRENLVCRLLLEKK